jgi:hypothetical protein
MGDLADGFIGGISGGVVGDLTGKRVRDSRGAPSGCKIETKIE